MRALWIVVLAGCWTAPRLQESIARPPEPTVAMRPARQMRKSPCESAVENAIDVSRADLEQNTKLKLRLDDLRDAAVDSCETLQWSAEAIACFQEAGEPSVMRACVNKLTSEQKSDMFKRIDDVANKSP